MGVESQPSNDKFMAAVFTEEWPEGAEMSHWHQHMTIFPWANGDFEHATLNLEKILQMCAPIDAYVADEAMFGAESDIKVWLLNPKSVLTGLHKVCIASINGLAKLEDKTFMGDNYTPHITPKNGQPELEIGSPIAVHRVSLVQKIGSSKIIAKNLELGNG